jgi:hypothetical protein
MFRPLLLTAAALVLGLTLTTTASAHTFRGCYHPRHVHFCRPAPCAPVVVTPPCAPVVVPTYCAPVRHVHYSHLWVPRRHCR